MCSGSGLVTALTYFSLVSACVEKESLGQDSGGDMTGAEEDASDSADEGGDGGGDGDGDGEACAQWMTVLSSEARTGINGVTTTEGDQVYLAGYIDGAFEGQESAGLRDTVMGTYSASGEQQWVQQMGTEVHEDARDITIDSSGDFLITGYLDGEIPPGSVTVPYDGFITKTDADGNTVWNRVFGTDGSEISNDVASTADGAVFVTGGTTGTFDGQVNSGGSDAFVVKYDSDGNMVWARQVGTAAYDDGYGVATDGDGAVLLAGATDAAFDGQVTSGGWDAVVVKLDASGEILWTRQFGSSEDDAARGVATDAAGNVFVAGWTSGAIDGIPNLGSRDGFLTKFDAAGTWQWTRLLSTESDESINDLTTDDAGNIYVGGYTQGSLEGHSNAGERDVMIAKYDTDGVLQQTWQVGTEHADSGYDITVGSNGHVYVGGDQFIPPTARVGFLVHVCPS